jgi:VanZ family protein
MLNAPKRSFRNQRLWQLGLACYWLALFIGTHIPFERLALNPGRADKFAHVAAFAVLTILLAVTWRHSAGRLHGRQLLWIGAVAILYGAIEETTQPLVNRSASLIDWWADAVGVALGLAIFWWWSDRWWRMSPNAAEVADEDQPRTRRRFSLKTLFLLMTITAAACYWMMLPTMNAQSFMRAIQLHDYATAESLFASEDNAFPGGFKNYDHFDAHVKLAPLTWGDLWKGERRISVTIDYGDDAGLIGCGADIYAHRHGLQLGLIVP